MKKLLTRNYVSIVKRGHINKKTTNRIFLDKIIEETIELRDSNYDPIELADIILTCLNMAVHNNLDIIKIMKDKIKVNESRKD